MALEKLKKLEEALTLYKKRCLKVEAERERLRTDLNGLKEENKRLSKGRDAAKKKIDSLLEVLGDVGN